MVSLLLVAALGIGAEPPVVACKSGGSTIERVQGRDAKIGPLTIMGALRTPGQRKNAFGGRGWKLPAGLDDGVRATLSVPPRLEGAVGFVYRLRAQARVGRRGVAGADSAVTFEACAGEGERTGWPGGIVAKGRRCARLLVQVDGDPEPIAKRVPLGRRCRPS
jgi:hypothetical protein